MYVLERISLHFSLCRMKNNDNDNVNASLTTLFSQVIQLLQKLCSVSSSSDLQSLIEKISLLRKAAASTSAMSKEMADLVTKYSHLLASQGELQMAFDYLQLVSSEDTAAPSDLKSRLAVALRIARPAGVVSSATTAAPTARQPSASASTHRSVIGNRSRQSSRSTPRGSVSYEARGSHPEQPPMMTPSVPAMTPVAAMMAPVPPMMKPAPPMMTPAPPMMTPSAPMMTPSIPSVTGPPPSAFVNPAAPPAAPPVATVDPAAASVPPKRSGLTARPRYAAHPDVVGTSNG